MSFYMINIKRIFWARMFYNCENRDLSSILKWNVSQVSNKGTESQIDYHKKRLKSLIIDWKTFSIVVSTVSWAESPGVCMTNCWLFIRYFVCFLGEPLVNIKRALCSSWKIVILGNITLCKFKKDFISLSWG